MKQIPLTQGKFALIDDEDSERVSKYSWCFQKGYARARIGNKIVRLHRFIMDFPNGIVDHINRNGLDNQSKNLRIVSSRENQFNRNANMGHKYKGVSRYFNKYAARIRINKKLIYLGLFMTEEQAALAYNKAAQKRDKIFSLNNI